MGLSRKLLIFLMVVLFFLAGSGVLLRYAVLYIDRQYETLDLLKPMNLELFDLAVVMSLITVESNFKTDAVGPHEKVGLFQLTPEEAKKAGLRIAEPLSFPRTTRFNRLFELPESGEAIALDERFDPRRNLEVGVSRFLDDKKTLIRDFHLTEKNASFFAVAGHLMGMDTLYVFLKEGAPRGRKEFPVWLKQYKGNLLSPKAKKRNLLILDEIFSSLSDDLPVLRERLKRGRPSLSEYFQSAKLAVVQATESEKWQLHILMGGCFFLLFAGLGMLLGVAPSRGLSFSFSVILIVALSTEIIDFWAAVANAKNYHPLDSMGDILGTISIPTFSFLIMRKIKLQFPDFM